MKKILCVILILSLIAVLPGCEVSPQGKSLVATTKPVYDFTAALCQGTDITVNLLITESLSCLHDYTLQMSQMQKLERADGIIMSGAGLEDFLTDVLENRESIIDASQDITLVCGDD